MSFVHLLINYNFYLVCLILKNSFSETLLKRHMKLTNIPKRKNKIFHKMCGKHFCDNP